MNFSTNTVSIACMIILMFLFKVLCVYDSWNLDLLPDSRARGQEEDPAAVESVQHARQRDHILHEGTPSEGHRWAEDQEQTTPECCWQQTKQRWSFHSLSTRFPFCSLWDYLFLSLMLFPFFFLICKLNWVFWGCYCVGFYLEERGEGRVALGWVSNKIKLNCEIVAGFDIKFPYIIVFSFFPSAKIK